MADCSCPPGTPEELCPLNGGPGPDLDVFPPHPEQLRLHLQRALKAQFPERAERLIRELERWLLKPCRQCGLRPPVYDEHRRWDVCIECNADNGLCREQVEHERFIEDLHRMAWIENESYNLLQSHLGKPLDEWQIEGLTPKHYREWRVTVGLFRRIWADRKREQAYHEGNLSRVLDYSSSIGAGGGHIPDLPPYDEPYNEIVLYGPHGG